MWLPAYAKKKNREYLASDPTADVQVFSRVGSVEQLLYVSDMVWKRWEQKVSNTIIMLGIDIIISMVQYTEDIDN